jgi:predicted ATPase
MERAAGLAHGDTAKIKFDKLDALLAQTSTSAQDVSLFADMLSLPNDGRYPTLDMTPEQRRQKTLEALGSQVKALSRSSPVLMIFEDAHWTDPTSLEVVSRIVDRLRNLRVLLIVTFRPEFDPPWIGRPYVTALTLNRLGQREIETVIDNVLGNKLIPASIRQDIIERTDGVPLFVEEMTQAVLEAGSEGAVQQTVASFPSPALAVPASLQASLMARLDRLGAAKELAQVGAAIGREFSHALLSAVVSKPEPTLVLTLDRLIAAGLLFQQGVPPHSSYLFKHALVQDAAYGTLLREPRRALHARIAETLEVQFPEIAENQPELLAHHCTEAGLIEKAARLWGRAGQRSLERSALVEAVAQFTRALDQITSLPASPELRREEIKLQIALIAPLIHVKGYGAPECKAAMERARLLIQKAEALGEPPEDPMLLFQVLYGFCVASYVAFDGDVLGEFAVQFLALAEKQGATVPLMIGHRVMGAYLTGTGNLKQGQAHYDRAIALYEPSQHRPLATRFSADARVSVLSLRSWSLWCLGYPDAALADADRALGDAREIGQAATLMYALGIAAPPYLQCGNYAQASAMTDELVSLAEEKGALHWRALAIVNRGLLATLKGTASEAIQMLTSGIAARRSVGGTHWLPLYLSNLSAARAELGQFDDALRCIGEAMTAMETTKDRCCEAEVYRTAGKISLESPEPDAAKAQIYFERALAVARQQEAKSWELRAAMSMARLWRDQGKRTEARELLAPIYGWFTEGFDTLDLKEAKALLDELCVSR